MAPTVMETPATMLIAIREMREVDATCAAARRMEWLIFMGKPFKLMRRMPHPQLHARTSGAVVASVKFCEATNLAHMHGGRAKRFSAASRADARSGNWRSRRRRAPAAAGQDRAPTHAR